jgi:hypothetical protein
MAAFAIPVERTNPMRHWVKTKDAFATRETREGRGCGAPARTQDAAPEPTRLAVKHRTETLRQAPLHSNIRPSKETPKLLD